MRIISLAKEILNKSAIDSWEIFITNSLQTDLGIKKGVLDKVVEAQNISLALRVIKNKRLGFSYITGSDFPSLLPKAIDFALMGAKTSEPMEYDFVNTCDLPKRRLNLLDRQKDNLEQKILRAKAMATSALDVDSRVVQAYPSEVSESLTTTYLINSKGLDVSYRHSHVQGVVGVVATENGLQEEAYDYQISRFWKNIDPVYLGRQAAAKALAQLGASPVAGGLYTIILNNEITAYFLQLLSSSLKADNVYKKRSLLADKVGQKIFPNKLSIYDDALAPGLNGTRPFDDEGSSSQTTPLITKGVVQGFIADRYWAQQAGLPATANSQRMNLQAPPEIGFSNLIMTKGRKIFADLVGGLDKGIIVDQVLGGHTADPVSGQFSLGLVGRLVEHGKISKPLRGNAMAGSVIDLFKQLTQVGNDVKAFGSVLCPSVVVDNIMVS